MVTRRGNAFDPIVLTCGKIAGGMASNIIPETVEMLGTMRATSEAARDSAHQGIRRVAANIAAAHLCEAEIDINGAILSQSTTRGSWISHAA
jgi:metal-dependent amidase/aminoacylase/carboxypeptidase family protein